MKVNLKKWKWRQRKAVKSVKNSKSAGGGGNDTAPSGNQTTGSSDDQAGCGNNTGPAKDVGVASEIQIELWSNIDVFKGKGFWTKLLLKNQDAEHRWERCNNFFFQRKTPELMRSILTPHPLTQRTPSGTSVVMEQMHFWTQHHLSSSDWRTQSRAWWQNTNLIRTQTIIFQFDVGFLNTTAAAGRGFVRNAVMKFRQVDNIAGQTTSGLQRKPSCVQRKHSFVQR